MTEDDRALVARAREGDRTAFEALVDRYGGRIHGLVLRMVRGNREEAEDLTQEALLRAWQALPRFRGDSGFYTWLYRIAVNRTLHRLQRKTLPVRSLDDPPDEDRGARPLEIPDSSADPERLAGNAELGQVLQEALERLPEASRTVFLLRETQGLGHDEIASILGSNSQAIRVRLHRAKKDLLRYLGPYLEARPS